MGAAEAIKLTPTIPIIRAILLKCYSFVIFKMLTLLLFNKLLVTIELITN